MANVLSDTKRIEVLALGRLGWPLRQIEAAIGLDDHPTFPGPNAALTARG
jgi:hypothetical protein